MNPRLPFTVKIVLPFAVIAAVFLGIFLSEGGKGHPLVLWLSSLGILITCALCIYQLVWLRRPLYRVRDLIAHLTRGAIPGFTASASTDEIGELERLLERHVENLRAITRFTRAMSTGDFTGSLEKLSSEDEVGDALLSLKESMKASMNETESRRREDEHRTWAAQGLARFSGFFREAEDDLQKLSGLLMKELVEYTEADVGALFIAEEGKREKLLRLTGSFAFDREKYLDIRFRFGEGLVGRAALERESIYITELPAEYMKIRSGLGEDVPSSLLLVPVVLDESVLGVIELASLGEIPPYQQEFIGQLADALATTLAKVQANLQNRELFERTREQAEALASQEEVFRMNLEKLEKAQEEFYQREEALKREIERLKNVSR